MNTRPNPTNQETPPGAIVGVVGTVAAAIGVLIILLQLTATSLPGRLFLVGVVLVVGGLLLRVESAIRATSRQRNAADDGAA
ncbi:hypothetical protein Q2K19_10590 [Micromonospora soli]|uniref:hypothetical protein n=1 Tax=Micromonospora sp. NBRC 110009 TaxID=3061627 RepID=UPI002671CB9E|nr:hypothetical protein [Micromonospora sp. NBRC 110009]WKU00885.1 hypothetical protein Q2K19_10590 [Micromonospora sp. NBRC 110009]